MKTFCFYQYIEFYSNTHVFEELGISLHWQKEVAGITHKIKRKKRRHVKIPKKKKPTRKKRGKTCNKNFTPKNWWSFSGLWAVFSLVTQGTVTSATKKSKGQWIKRNHSPVRKSKVTRSVTSYVYYLKIVEG